MVSRMASFKPWLGALATGFLFAAVSPLACGEQDYPDRAFRCDPSDADSCPGAYLCCSTDPAAVDPDDPGAIVAPDYAGGSGLAVFSGFANEAGEHGRCVDPASIGNLDTFEDGAGPVGCPRPCNPTWDDALVASVCGAEAFCCQTDEIGENDCVLDPALGTAGCYRPTTGNDIVGFGGIDSSNWSRSDHDTHQDPNGSACTDFAEAVGGGDELLFACFRKLATAEQRGLCTAANGATDAASVCPLADPSYVDACAARNEAEGLAGC